MTDLTADELRTSWPDAHLSELLDSAQRHLLNDDPAQAITVWKTMIRAGGSDADWGHLEYADFLFSRGLDDEARSELAELMAGQRVFSQPWRLAAELLEDREQLGEALVWYSAAADCLTAEELRYPNGPVWARDVRMGLRRIKWKMGIPLNEADLLVRISAAEAEEKWWEMLSLIANPEVIEGRLQVWFGFRDLLPVDPAGPDLPPLAGDRYFRRVEATLQTHGERTMLLPRNSESFQRLREIAVGARSIEELRAFSSQYDEGNAFEWPPGRNKGCWCGSGTKYKRCCGVAG